MGTQIAFTCNQPRNFVLWINGKECADLDPSLETLALAEQHIAGTRTLLAGHLSAEGDPPDRKHLELGADLYADLTGREYLEDFLLPNFDVHLVTICALMRDLGVQGEKYDYMLHLLQR